MESYLTSLLLLITLLIAPQSYATEPASTEDNTIWNKPHAIIAPSMLQVIRGEKAIFSNLSKVEGSAQVSLKWSNTQNIRVKPSSDISIDTSLLALGKHAITLTVVDDRGFSDSMSAILLVLKNHEEQRNKEDTLYFANLEKEITALNRPTESTQTKLPIISNHSSQASSPEQQHQTTRVKYSPTLPVKNDITHNTKQEEIQKSLVTLISLGIILFSLATMAWFIWYYRQAKHPEKSIMMVKQKNNNVKKIVDKKISTPENTRIKFSTQIDMGVQEIFIASDKEQS